MHMYVDLIQVVVNNSGELLPLTEGLFFLKTPVVSFTHDYSPELLAFKSKLCLRFLSDTTQVECKHYAAYCGSKLLLMVVEQLYDTKYHSGSTER